jgi:hypothetical protein
MRKLEVHTRLAAVTDTHPPTVREHCAVARHNTASFSRETGPPISMGMI